LEKAPANRYASAARLAEDLGRFLDGRPTEARPLSTLTHAWRWCRRHPARAVALVAVVLLLLTVAGVSAWTASRERAFRHQAQVQVAEGSRDRARQLRDRDEEGEALLWFARALTQVPEGADDLAEEVRTEMAASARDLPALSLC